MDDQTTFSALPDVSLKKFDRVIFGGLTTGMLALLVAGGYALWLLKDAILEAAQDTLKLGVMTFVGVLMAVVFGEMWMNRRNVLLKMKLIAKSIRKSIVHSDPIGTIDVAISSLRDKLEHARAQKQAATAARKITESNVAKAQASQVDELALASEAQKRARTKAEVDLHLVKAQRWSDTKSQLASILDNQERRAARIADAEAVCVNGIENLENQKATLSMRLDAIKADAAQAKAFKAFFGHSEEMELIDLAVEDIEKQSAACEAEVEQMLTEAEPSIQQAQLSAAVQADRARAQLAASSTIGALGVGSNVKEGVIVGGKR